MDKLRLNKVLAEVLGVSRREADDAIAAGHVTVNQKPARLGQRVDFSDEVCYNGKIVPLQAQHLYIALNKPAGYVCSRRRQGDTPTIYEILPEKYQNLKTVGRLDKDSSGLILLTNDGDFAFQMTHPKFIKTKMIADFGIDLSDGKSQLGLERIDDSRERWRVTMHEGRNRQIRRTFAAVGYGVTKLHRTEFGKYRLDGLAEGTAIEIQK